MIEWKSKSGKFFIEVCPHSKRRYLKKDTDYSLACEIDPKGDAVEWVKNKTRSRIKSNKAWIEKTEKQLEDIKKQYNIWLDLDKELS